MAYTSKSGRQFTNRSQMMHEDRRHGAGIGAAVEQPKEDEGWGEEDGEAIAGEHGPAHMVTVTHDHEAGTHHVHSEHPDGHVHESDHESAEAAHDHAKKLAGHEHSEAAIEGLKQFADEEGEE